MGDALSSFHKPKMRGLAFFRCQWLILLILLVVFRHFFVSILDVSSDLPLLTEGKFLLPLFWFSFFVFWLVEVHFLHPSLHRVEPAISNVDTVGVMTSGVKERANSIERIRGQAYSAVLQERWFCGSSMNHKTHLRISCNGKGKHFGFNCENYEDLKNSIPRNVHAME